MAPLTSNLTRFSPVAVVCFAALGCTTVMPGCDQKASSDIATVKIAGKTFHLEIAAEPEKQFLGLGKRKSIDEDGGMIFVFREPEVRDFVMRDCSIPIDILYLDGSGRVLKMHAMVPEEPRKADGTEDADKDGFNALYDARLTKYSSRYPSQLVVELKGGKIKEIGVKENDMVKLDAEGLKKLAKH